MLVRSFSTTSRPALRAAACGGRPRAGSDTTATGEPASPTTLAQQLKQRAGTGVQGITQGEYPQDDPRRLAGEVNELVEALVAEIEWLRNELEYAKLANQLPAAGQPGPAIGVVDAVKADPHLQQGDRDRLIAMYRDLVQQRVMEGKKRKGRT